MKMFVIAVRDGAVQSFMQPSFCNHTGAAVRAFIDHCRDPQTDFHKHPEDYELYQVGEFDDQTGKFTDADPIRLSRAVDHVVPGGQPQLVSSNS